MSDPLPRYLALVVPALGPAAPDALVDARRAVGLAATDLSAGTAVVAGSWRGVAARRAQRCLDRRAVLLDTTEAELAAAQQLLAELARAQAGTAAQADAVMAVWWSASAVLPAWSPALRVLAAIVGTGLAEVREDHRAALARVAAGFDALARGARAVGDAVAAEQGLPVAAPGRLPGPDTSPAEVARWWSGLDHAARAALVAREPDALAALPGLPPTVLDRVNRARVHRDAARPGPAGDTARAVLRTLADAERRAAPGGGAPGERVDPIGPVLLLGYRDGVPGGVAVAYGDPSTADAVAVAVPGTGNAPGSPGLTDQAAALRRRLDADDPAATAATVQWLDYDAPDSIVSAAVLDPAGALAGAPRLVADVDGWRAAAAAAGREDQRVTVVGHSYGSTVVGLAAARGLAADDVVLLGSPGAGVPTAAALSPGPGHVWVGATEHDPVVALTDGRWFVPEAGSPPATDRPGFGAVALPTADPAAVGGAHSAYFDPGSVALANLSAVVRGDPGALTAAAPLAGTGTAAALVDLAADPARAGLAVGRALADLDGPGALRAGAAGLGETAGDALDVALRVVGGTTGALARVGRGLPGAGWPL